MKTLVTIIAILFASPTFGQINAKGASRLAKQSSVSQILERVETHARAGNTFIKCCKGRYGKFLTEKQIEDLGSLGFQVRLRPDQQRLKTLDRESYIISWKGLYYLPDRKIREKEQH